MKLFKDILNPLEAHPTTYDKVTIFTFNEKSSYPKYTGYNTDYSIATGGYEYAQATGLMWQHNTRDNPDNYTFTYGISHAAMWFRTSYESRLLGCESLLYYSRSATSK